MTIQRLHQVGHRFRAAPGRQGDDTLAVANGDARADGGHLIPRHGFRIDPHQHSGLIGSRLAELPGGLLDKTLLPLIIDLYRVRLDFKGSEVSTGSACNSMNTVLSHVIRAIAVPEEYAYGTIRVTLGMDNTMDQMRILATQIYDIVSRMQKSGIHL